VLVDEEAIADLHPLAETAKPLNWREFRGWNTAKYYPGLYYVCMCLVCVCNLFVWMECAYVVGTVSVHVFVCVCVCDVYLCKQPGISPRVKSC
jgi:hypothetical protein